MPVTYDQRDTSSLEDFSQPDPTDPGSERFTNGAFRRVDAQGVYDPRTVWRTPHWSSPLLPHLVDFWAGNAATVVTLGQPFPTSVTAYYDAASTKAAARVVYTRNALQQATTVVWTTYATDGVTVANTCTENITYIGAYETSRTRTYA